MLEFFDNLNAMLLQVPVLKGQDVPVQDTGSGFTWEIAATVLGIAALIVGAIVQTVGKREKPEVIKHVNDLTETVNELTSKLAESNNKIAALDANVHNLTRENEEMKQLIRDIEKDNFNALSKVVDKVDNIKDLLINFKAKK